MKKILIILSVIAVVLVGAFFGFRAYTKVSSPEAIAVYEKNGLKIQVDYCRPSKKGRVVFGELEPYGKVWRTGANEATQITFNKSVSFAGKPVNAGTYSLFTIPDKETWIVILNSELEQWGAFNYNEAKDVLRVQVPATTTEITEMFTINFQESNQVVTMLLLWDQTKVEVPILPQSTASQL